MIIFLIINKNLAVAHPESSNEWILEVSNYLMYEIGVNFHHPIWKEQTAAFVLEEICALNGIDVEYIDRVPAVKRLHFKLVSLASKMKSATRQGGRQLAELKNKSL